MNEPNPPQMVRSMQSVAERIFRLRSRWASHLRDKEEIKKELYELKEECIRENRDFYAAVNDIGMTERTASRYVADHSNKLQGKSPIRQLADDGQGREEIAGPSQSSHEPRSQRIGQQAPQSHPLTSSGPSKAVEKDLNRTEPVKPKAKPDNAPTDKTDAFGNPIPKRCLDAYCDPWIQEAIDFLGVTAAHFWEKRLADGLEKRKQHFGFINAKDFVDGCGMAGNTIEQLLNHLKENRPAGVCPKCSGEGCAACKMKGLVPRGIYESLKGKK